MASKGKTKEKLKRQEFKCGTKIINLKRFAYDMLALSMRKFGVARDCIAVCNIQENDYGYPDFIVVLTRFLFRNQIAHRNRWYKAFKDHYESSKFESYSEIKPALQRIFHDFGRFPDSGVLIEFLITLTIISEFILFLYTNNCKLHLMELAGFWLDCWHPEKKKMERAGGLACLYEDIYNSHENRIDIFLNQFITGHCIPYKESSTLWDTYNEEYCKFFQMPKEPIAKMQEQRREQVWNHNRIVSQFLSHCSLALEGGKASAIDPLRNTGLGILQHEVLLQRAMEADTATLPQDLPSTSRQRTSTERRGPSNVKEKKKPSSPSNVEDLGRLNTGRLGEDAATSPENLPSTRGQGTEKDPKGPSSQKKGQKISTPNLEVLDPMSTDLLRDDAATLPRNLTSTSGEGTKIKRKKSNRKKKSDACSNVEDLE